MKNLKNFTHYLKCTLKNFFSIVSQPTNNCGEKSNNQENTELNNDYAEVYTTTTRWQTV